MATTDPIATVSGMDILAFHTRSAVGPLELQEKKQLPLSWPTPVEYALHHTPNADTAYAIAGDDEERQFQMRMLLSESPHTSSKTLVRAILGATSLDVAENVAARLAYTQPNLDPRFLIGLDELTIQMYNAKLNIVLPTYGNIDFPQSVNAPRGYNMHDTMDLEALCELPTIYIGTTLAESLSGKTFGAYLVWHFLTNGVLPSVDTVKRFLTDMDYRTQSILDLSGSLSHFGVAYYAALGTRQAKKINGTHDPVRAINADRLVPDAKF